MNEIASFINNSRLLTKFSKVIDRIKKSKFFDSDDVYLIKNIARKNIRYAEKNEKNIEEWLDKRLASQTQTASTVVPLTPQEALGYFAMSNLLEN